MSNRIEARKIRARNVTKVLANFRYRRRHFSKITAGEQVRIQANDVVACGLHHRPRHGADITLMACQKYFHERPVRCAIRLSTLGSEMTARSPFSRRISAASLITGKDIPERCAISNSE